MYSNNSYIINKSEYYQWFKHSDTDDFNPRISHEYIDKTESTFVAVGGTRRWGKAVTLRRRKFVEQT